MRYPRGGKARAFNKFGHFCYFCQLLSPDPLISLLADKMFADSGYFTRLPMRPNVLIN